jgi:putative hydrolase of the HAD superfamily
LNVVFDLGGVIVRWNADAFLESVFECTDTRESLRRGLLEHQDWIELDRGTLDSGDAVERTVARTGVPVADVERLLAAVPPFLVPYRAAVELVTEVREAGHRLFVLSNMHHASADYLERSHDFWSLFDGAVYSCRIGHVKPEPEIYQHLLSTYELEPAQTVFIDDLRENLESASRFGIRTVHYRDVDQCRRELRGHGVLGITA